MKFRRSRYIRRVLLSRRAWRVRLAFLLGAVLVGLVSSAFGVLSEQANRLFFRIADAEPWAPLLLTPFGLALVAWLARRFFPGSEGSGINQVVAALELRTKTKFLTLRLAAGKILLTLLGQSCGASIGREGPTVHVAAAIMYSMRRVARFPADYMARGMLLAGGAAGISAAFNTPLAGVVFAFEEMLRGFTPRLAGLVILTVLLSALVSMLFMDQRYYFGTVSAGRPDALGDWLAVLLCGVVAGLAGGLFAFLILRISGAIAPLVAGHGVAVAFVCGAVLVLMGVLTDYRVMGSGYDIAKALVIEAQAPDPLYPIYKFVASLASYLSGIPGGIFAPALSTGGGIGADLYRLLPVASLELMVLLGMVAYFAGAVKSPLTGFVIVMEMTDDQYTLLALMGAAMVGYGASFLLSPQPLYHALAQRLVAQQPPAARRD
ncbi:chloride channel protein [uncultured Thiohalocapsa sp.]|uniref:chloride channel protein n=1 Tax=uncultured Thiohalocapsa sp. TaxID=768990 RepID=UPI0025EFF22E|nr:chloride channel protein [uncultured Thiohalocapsa sp.]